MEKICIVKRRKEGYREAHALPVAEGREPGGSPRPVAVPSVKLTPEQTAPVQSNKQFQELRRGEANPVIFNLHPQDALPPRLLTPEALSEMLGVSCGTVLKLTRAGVLKSYKIGRLRRFSVADMTEYLRRCAVPDKLAGDDNPDI